MLDVRLPLDQLGDFGVSDYFGITTFSTGIYRAWYGMGDPVSSLRLAGCLLFLVAAILVIERVSRANQGGNAIARDVTVRRMTPGPFSQFICFLACALPVLIGFVIPVGTLAILAFGPLVTDPPLREGKVALTDHLTHYTAMATGFGMKYLKII